MSFTEQDNDAAAREILRELISGRLERGEPLSPRLLKWYLDYLEVQKVSAEAPAAAQFEDQAAMVRRRLALAMS